MTEPTVPPPRFERLAHVDRRGAEILGRPANERPSLIFVTDHPADGACVPAPADRRKPRVEIATFL
jgi:hypothetical protein